MSRSLPTNFKNLCLSDETSNDNEDQTLRQSVAYSGQSSPSIDESTQAVVLREDSVNQQSRNLKQNEEAPGRRFKVSIGANQSEIDNAKEQSIPLSNTQEIAFRKQNSFSSQQSNPEEVKETPSVSLDQTFNQRKRKLDALTKDSLKQVKKMVHPDQENGKEVITHRR